MTIEIGLWIAPTIGTLVAFAGAWRCTPEVVRGGYLEGLFEGVIGLIYYLIATVASLMFWLIYALAT